MSNISKCLCCFDPPEEENPILKCKKCEISAHVLCYGILDTDNFICSPCTNDIDPGSIICDLCLKLNGCMKQTTTGNWVHVLCALFVKGVEINDPEKMEPIDITKVQKSLNKCCVFCEQKSTCMKCNKRGCDKYMHIPCGFENGTLKETDKNDLLTFDVYCAEHARETTSKGKRLSSDKIKYIVRSKVVTKHLAQAMKHNSSWIYNKLMKPGS